jgi:hypothetical protein
VRFTGGLLNFLNVPGFRGILVLASVSIFEAAALVTTSFQCVGFFLLRVVFPTVSSRTSRLMKWLLYSCH